MEDLNNIKISEILEVEEIKSVILPEDDDVSIYVKMTSREHYDNFRRLNHVSGYKNNVDFDISQAELERLERTISKRHSITLDAIRMQMAKDGKKRPTRWLWYDLKLWFLRSVNKRFKRDENKITEKVEANG